MTKKNLAPPSRLPKPKLEQIRRALNLDHVLTRIPYDKHGVGLELPDTLTDLESREIFAATLANHANLHQGDLFNWLEAHPKGDHMSYDRVQKIFMRLFSYSTFYNRKSLAKRVPLKNRIATLTVPHYDAVAKLPPDRQKRLLDWAAHEHVQPEELAIEAAQDEECILAGLPLPDAPPERHAGSLLTSQFVEMCRRINAMVRVADDKAEQAQLRFVHEAITEIIPLTRLARYADRLGIPRKSLQQRTSDAPNGHRGPHTRPRKSS